MSHYDRCRALVLGHADELIEAIKAGRLNAAAFEGLMCSYLDHPAFWPDWREQLLALALQRHTGHPRAQP